MSSLAPPVPLPAHILRVHATHINAVSFSQDNERLYSGDSSGSVVVTSTRTLRSIAAWKAHTDGLLGVQEWEDSIITHGRDNKLHVWSRVIAPAAVGDSATLPDLPVPSLCYSMDVNALNFCRFSLMTLSAVARVDSRHALVAIPNLVESSLADVWALPSCQRLHAAIGNRGKSDPIWQSDGRTGDKTGILMSIHLFDAPHPSIPDRPQLHLLAAYENGSVTMWQNTSTERDTSVEGRGWEAIWSSKMHVESVMAMAVSRDNTFALTVSADHLVVRYDLYKAGQPNIAQEECFVAHRIKHAGNGAVAFRADGRVCAVGGWDGKIRLYSTKTIKPLGTLAYHTGNCQALAFAHELDTNVPSVDASSPDNDIEDDMTTSEKLTRSRWIAAGGHDRRLSIWELMSFQRI